MSLPLQKSNKFQKRKKEQKEKGEGNERTQKKTKFKVAKKNNSLVI